MIAQSKYVLYIISFSLVVTLSFANTSSTFGQSVADTACSGKKNGDACSYQRTVTTGGKSQPTGTATQTESGFCDRTDRNTSAASNPLTCKTLPSDKNGWEDCVVNGDACKLAGELGVCGASQVRGSRCDTSKKPPGSPGGATLSKCGTATCTSGQVCVQQGGSPVCTNDASQNGKCGTATCTGGQVCVQQGGSPVCTNNAVTPGTPANTGANPDASSPQTVGFVNPIRFNSIPELIAGIINALLGILGAITVAILVMSGFKYMTSSNPGEVGQALDGIRNAIVGLMIIMGSFLITQYVISALVS